MTPKRIQRKRTKGWRKPPGAVIVDRSTKWGNPFKWTDYPAVVVPYNIDGDKEPIRVADSERRRWAVVDFKSALLWTGAIRDDYPSVDEIRAELAGKDLVCWCKEGGPCHAEVLLSIANQVAS